MGKATGKREKKRRKENADTEYMQMRYIMKRKKQTMTQSSMTGSGNSTTGR